MNWTKSTKCEFGTCVEIGFTSDPSPMVAVRNSEMPTEVAWFTTDEWQAFLAGAKLGEFDLK
jgi:Domain of unknown function (DUF397)